MKVSVAMATYNGEAFLKEQLDSILAQLNENDELIISDDNSSDQTPNIINAYKDRRIQFFQNKKSLGFIKNFENALQKSNGEIIFLSDQDDVWLPGKVDACKKYLQQYDLVTTDCIVTNEKLEKIAGSYFELLKSGKGVLQNLKKNTYLGCCMAFKKKLLKVALPFPEKIPTHDIWLGFVADIFFKPFFLKEPFILYRRHSNNATTTTAKSKYNLMKRVSFRLNTLRYLPLINSRYKKLKQEF